jgi:hypothetical protein
MEKTSFVIFTKYWVAKSRRAGNVAYVGEMRSSYSILVGKPEGKKPLGRLRHR